MTIIKKKPLAKKKLVKESKPFSTEKVVKVVNPMNIPTGTYFSAVINGRKCVGIIYNDTKDKYLYFCQNNITGSNTIISDYKFSYTVSYGNIELYVRYLDFPKPPKNITIPILLPEISGYTPKIRVGNVKIGCCTVKNSTIRELVKYLKDK